MKRDDGAPGNAVEPPQQKVDAESLKARGNDFLAQGRLREAAVAYLAAIEHDPHSASLRVNLGFTLQEQGRLTEAADALRKAVELDPGSFDAHFLLGMLLAAQGTRAPAAQHLSAALTIDPDNKSARLELCRQLVAIHRFSDAETSILEGLVRDPADAELHLYLGNILIQSNRCLEAIDSFSRALDLRSDLAAAHNNLALALEKVGRCDEAIAHFRLACKCDPAYVEAHRNLLFTLSYDPKQTPETYLQAARGYGRLLESRAKPYRDWPSATSGPPTHPLRVGFVSPDFRTHPVGYFLEAVLTAWQGRDIELWAYSSNPTDDATTQRLKKRFKRWADIATFSDEAAAKRIRDDGIHLLVDLAGHTDGGRLPLFAWKPAPVQVSWLGFFASTGLAAMDYFIADEIAVPAESESQFSERVWRLADTRLCFTPPRDLGQLAPGEPPCMSRGHVTLGSFQALPKINDQVLATWSQILAGVPTARLRVQSSHFADESLRERFGRRCVEFGIRPDRLDLLRPTGRAAYLSAHREVDLLLDTFPYPGGTTTCEAMWMGVPTLTLQGGTLLSRQGTGLLRCVGLDDWVAQDTTQYVARAIAFAQDVDKLSALRSTLRDRMLASALTDAGRFASQLQEAFLGMWREAASRPSR